MNQRTVWLKNVLITPKDREGTYAKPHKHNWGWEKNIYNSPQVSMLVKWVGYAATNYGSDGIKVDASLMETQLPKLWTK